MLNNLETFILYINTLFLSILGLCKVFNIFIIDIRYILVVSLIYPVWLIITLLYTFLGSIIVGIVIKK